eukprot:Sspe_Gene.15811::Locus_5514_Transcript_1_1_Confidence_1.000_Length_2544::g.15811::m.15811
MLRNLWPTGGPDAMHSALDSGDLATVEKYLRGAEKQAVASYQTKLPKMWTNRPEMYRPGEEEEKMLLDHPFFQLAIASDVSKPVAERVMASYKEQLHDRFEKMKEKNRRLAQESLANWRKTANHAMERATTVQELLAKTIDEDQRDAAWRAALLKNKNESKDTTSHSVKAAQKGLRKGIKKSARLLDEPLPEASKAEAAAASAPKPKGAALPSKSVDSGAKVSTAKPVDAAKAAGHPPAAAKVPTAAAKPASTSTAVMPKHHPKVVTAHDTSVRISNAASSVNIPKTDQAAAVAGAAGTAGTAGAGASAAASAQPVGPSGPTAAVAAQPQTTAPAAATSSTPATATTSAATAAGTASSGDTSSTAAAATPDSSQATGSSTTTSSDTSTLTPEQQHQQAVYRAIASAGMSAGLMGGAVSLRKNLDRREQSRIEKPEDDHPVVDVVIIPAMTDAIVAAGTATTTAWAVAQASESATVQSGCLSLIGRNVGPAVTGVFAAVGVGTALHSWSNGKMGTRDLKKSIAKVAWGVGATVGCIAAAGASLPAAAAIATGSMALDLVGATDSAVDKIFGKDQRALRVELIRQYAAVLGTSPKSTDEEVRQKFRELSLLVHPDKRWGGTDQDALLLNEACARLLLLRSEAREGENRIIMFGSPLPKLEEDPAKGDGKPADDHAALAASIPAPADDTVVHMFFEEKNYELSRPESPAPLYTSEEPLNWAMGTDFTNEGTPGGEGQPAATKRRLRHRTVTAPLADRGQNG